MRTHAVRLLTLALAGLAGSSAGCSCKGTNESPQPPGSTGRSELAQAATLEVDGAQYPVRSALRVKRGDLTEQVFLSSDRVGCELASNPAAGAVEQRRMRVAWTLAPDFNTGQPRVVSTWAAIFREDGGAWSGPMAGAALKLPGSPHAGAPLDIELSSGVMQGHRFAAKGSVTPVECPARTPNAPSIDSLKLMVGRVRVNVRAVLVREPRPGAPRWAIELYDHEVTCLKSDGGELTVAFSPFPSGDWQAQLFGNALAEPRAKIPATVGATPEKFDPNQSEAPITLAVSETFGDLKLEITGQATAHVCRVPETFRNLFDAGAK